MVAVVIIKIIAGSARDNYLQRDEMRQKFKFGSWGHFTFIHLSSILIYSSIDSL